jgi:hypothetical protein
MRSLENTEQDFCMPGIGFVFQEGRVLHICPNHDATATCFYIADDRSLHRAAVSADEQADLLRLFYRQERARLIQAFGETVPDDPWWHDILRLFSFARSLFSSLEHSSLSAPLFSSSPFPTAFLPSKPSVACLPVLRSCFSCRLRLWPPSSYS